MFRNRHTLIAVLAVTSALGTGAVAFADTAAPSPSQVTVTPVTSLKAGDMPPGDVPGVRAIRAGKPIPAGYVLIGQRVDVTRGSTSAGAFLRFQCPGAKRLRSFVTSGRVGFTAERSYVGHRITFIGSFPPFSNGATKASGTVYAVCR